MSKGMGNTQRAILNEVTAAGRAGISVTEVYRTLAGALSMPSMSRAVRVLVERGVVVRSGAFLYVYEVEAREAEVDRLEKDMALGLPWWTRKQYDGDWNAEGEKA